MSITPNSLTYQLVNLNILKCRKNDSSEQQKRLVGFLSFRAGILAMALQ
ncbi:hypothetical protein HMPREF6745_0356 [Prevotella sp. oral taxon 472 str. F0295]|nr:hypothetical protein HMPREF6745_0356 [Prevotella sp. oral taxon 472 str. F0295]